MIYDGECAFCGRWIRRWRRLTGDSVAYLSYQEALDRYPQVTREAAAEAVQLVLPAGEVLSGAAAVCRTLEGVRGWRWADRAYRRVPGFGPVSEALYRLVARHRGVAGRLSS